jgi:hypothetical protein
VPLYAVTAVNMRAYDSSSKAMKATSNGSSFIPHHIQDDVSLVPVASSTTALTQSKLISGAACCFYNLDAFFDLDGYLILYDLAAVPTNGAQIPLKCFKAYSDQHFSYSPPKPLQLANGLVVVFSTTAPFLLTLGGSHMFCSAEIGAFNGEAA